MKIESIVQTVNHHLSPDNKMSDVAKLLEHEGKTALPVINHDGTLLGLVTKREMAEASAGAPAGAPDRGIGELVKPVGITCSLNDDIEDLARQASSQSQTHVAVVDDQGGLVGIADLSPYQKDAGGVQHREEAVDEALEETFPASDPISPQ
ncbi:CBS domain-containing protein [Alteromonas pelagimontana]|uniref:CBS domain-containing protein n=1 Tax=Alteromonas pelagimontana TaxID=1858656 RepID=A0A6M4ME61_9ALTE|nr:CBS domain-containing protein [Alteromonas pelagimontana]QJR81481.1 CBS domain-containing protein [Alteromonas pelagimontana]